MVRVRQIFFSSLSAAICGNRIRPDFEHAGYTAYVSGPDIQFGLLDSPCVFGDSNYAGFQVGIYVASPYADVFVSSGVAEL